MPKKITMTAKPQAAVADDWVAGTSVRTSEEQPQSKSNNNGAKGAASPTETAAVKRLTIDIPEELHARIKSQCAMRRTKMADEIRLLLEDKFAEHF